MPDLSSSDVSIRAPAPLLVIAGWMLLLAMDGSGQASSSQASGGILIK